MQGAQGYNHEQIPRHSGVPASAQDQQVQSFRNLQHRIQKVTQTAHKTV